MNQENFNDAVYTDEELSIDRKIELLNICHKDYSRKIWEIFDELSPIEKIELLRLITSAQLVIFRKFMKDKN